MPFRQVIRYILRCKRYLKGYWLKIVGVGIAMNGYTILIMVVPIVNKKVFDEVIPNKDMHLLLVLSGITLLLTVMISGLSSLQGYLKTKLEQQLSNDIRLDLYEHLLRLPLTVYIKQQVGDLMSRVKGDAGRMASFLQDTLVVLMSNCFTLLLAVFLIFHTNWKLGLITLVFVPAFASTFFIYKNRHYKLGQVFYKKEGDFFSTMQEGLSGIQTIKCTVNENQEARRLLHKAVQIMDAAMRLFWVQNWTLVGAMLISTISGGIVILFGAYQVIRGNMTIGGIVAVNTWLTMTGGPINNLAMQYLHMQQILGSVQRVLDLLDIPTESDDPRRTISLPEQVTSIKFENVKFTYDSSREPVLRGIDLEVRRGEKIAIAGLSGAGKTTIVDLLMGLYHPTKGTIRINGHDISTVRLESLRRRIALVSQDTFLFNTSVMENIRYGRPDASEEEVVEAAKAAYAHDFILQLPSGYETVIGERGVTLSGGQRQRIAIAQAFLKDAPILILDEAMSSVDSEAESIIQESLNRLIRGKTAIIISHRLSTLQRADRLLILEDGVIVSTGTHSDLVRADGLYRTLYEMQHQ